MSELLDACGRKHMAILTLVTVVVLTVCGGTIAYCNSTVEEIRAHTAATLREIDARVRIVEQAESANAARYEAIQRSIARLEAIAWKSKEEQP